MNNKYCVYKHTTPSNKVYIGITSQDVKKRWRYGYGYKYNKHFYRAIKKYGWDNIKHDILYESLSKEDACELEKSLIKKYDSTNGDNGYNTSTGGEAPYGVIFTEERKQKISNSKKGHIVSKETRQKIRNATLGSNHWNFGKNLSEETKKKISESHKGIRFSKDHISKLKTFKKGHIPWNKGKNLSYDTIEKIRSTRKRLSVICLETNVKYPSIRDASRTTNINKSHISEVCRGKRKTAGKYHWMYVGGVNNV